MTFFVVKETVEIKSVFIGLLEMLFPKHFLAMIF